MGKTLERWPDWAEKALQGLAFWIGHRHSLYRHYPLLEGALVAETCNLIHANLRHSEALHCEVQYSRLVPDGQWPGSMGVRARADLVVTDQISPIPGDETRKLMNDARFVIEVKRASAPAAQINEDLKRLAKVQGENARVRAFLFLVSEAARPNQRFVTAEGRATRGLQNIPGTASKYRVRRACKASAAFSGKASAHYACIIEVFA